MVTRHVDITTADGLADSYLAHPDEGSHPGVLFLMDAIGLRPAIYSMVERLANEGYVVLAPNLFYRTSRAPVLDLPEFIDISDRERLRESFGKLFASVNPEMLVRDVGSYLDYLQRLPQTCAGKMGVTGYCMGGGLALRAAGNYPERIAAAASFHGGNLATEDDNSPHRLAGRMAAEVYVGHADQDGSMPPEQIERLERAFSAAGVRYRAELYKGALHGFTMRDTSVHNEAAAEQHWDRLIDLLRRNLKC